MADEEEYIAGWTEDFDAEAHRQRMQVFRKAANRDFEEQWAHRRAMHDKWLEVSEKYTDNWGQRNWDVWREYRTTKIDQKTLGEKYGISSGRVSSIVKKCDAKVKRALNISWLSSVHEARDGILGVEFVFRHEETISIHDPKLKEWNRLNNKDGVSFRCRKQDEDDG